MKNWTVKIQAFWEHVSVLSKGSSANHEAPRINKTSQRPMDDGRFWRLWMARQFTLASFLARAKRFRRHGRNMQDLLDFSMKISEIQWSFQPDRPYAFLVRTKPLGSMTARLWCWKKRETLPQECEDAIWAWILSYNYLHPSINVVAMQKLQTAEIPSTLFSIQGCVGFVLL